MSKLAYRELATNFTLWCKFVLLKEQVSEREFNEMSIDEKARYPAGMLRPREPSVPAAAHSRRHASVKEWVDKMQAFWNWKLSRWSMLVDHLGRWITGLVRNNRILPV